MRTERDELISEMNHGMAGAIANDAINECAHVDGRGACESCIKAAADTQIEDVQMVAAAVTDQDYPFPAALAEGGE